MCSSKMPKQKEPVKPTPPPPPPPAPEAPPTSPVRDEATSTRKTEDANARARRTGTQSLRIDLNLGGGSTGLNIPA